jgi:hypothetical protein
MSDSVKTLSTETHVLRPTEALSNKCNGCPVFRFQKINSFYCEHPLTAKCSIQMS